MKKYSLLILLITLNSFGQKKIWYETVLKLQKEVVSLDKPNRKFTVKNDTLLMTLKPLHDENRTIKIPLKKLVSLVSSFNELVLFIRRDKTADNSYSCTKIDNSQLMIAKPFDREKHADLIKAFRKIIGMNRSKKKIE